MKTLRARNESSRLTRRPREAAPLAFAGMLLCGATVACTGPGENTPVATFSTVAPTHGVAPRTSKPSATPRGHSLRFVYHPGEGSNFSASSCHIDSHSWITEYDSNPLNRESVADATTIGMARKWDAKMNPVFSAGVTIRGLGKKTYELATSDDLDKVAYVDLKKGAYAQVLSGENGKYDAVFTARTETSGDVEFTLNCLPEFGFNDKKKPVRSTTPLVPQPGTVQEASS